MKMNVVGSTLNCTPPLRRRLSHRACGSESANGSENGLSDTCGAVWQSDD